ncbi:hypothetical protein F8388_012308 [Cannabis sativa]|nr:hypothetical protein F8388_012308 [Cannabis sativa]
MGCREWDEEIVQDVFNEDDAAVILGIPLAVGEARDSWYWFKERDGIYSSHRGIHSPLLMEAHALHNALTWCITHSFQPNFIASQCKILIDYISSNASHNIHLNKFLIEIKSLLFSLPQAIIGFISRGANEKAHRLAKYVLNLDQEAF